MNSFLLIIWKEVRIIYYESKVNLNYMEILFIEELLVMVN